MGIKRSWSFKIRLVGVMALRLDLMPFKLSWKQNLVLPALDTCLKLQPIVGLDLVFRNALRLSTFWIWMRVIKTLGANISCLVADMVV